MEFEVVIVGGGAAGLYAGYCCGMVGLRFCVVESLCQLGGQCTALYSAKKIYGVPGFVDATALEFITKLRTQACDFSNNFLLGAKVVAIEKSASGDFLVQVQQNNETSSVTSKNLIIATGIGNMMPRVPVDISGFDAIDPGSDFVQYYCENVSSYQDKKVIIAGGGDTAIDFAISIAAIAKQIIIIHRRQNITCEKFKLNILQNFITAGKLTIKLSEQVLSIFDDGHKRKIKTTTCVFDVDNIVFCYGFSAQGAVDYLSKLGLNMTKNILNVDIANMQTIVPNCFAVGDVARYINKKKNLISAFFEADKAVRHIKNNSI